MVFSDSLILGFPPAFWVVVLSIAVFSITLFVSRRKQRHQYELDRLKQVWGQPGESEYDPAHVAFYHESIRSGEPVIDDRTWADLNMDALFHRMNTCRSMPGSQVLYALLRRPIADRTLITERNERITAWSQNPEARRKARYALGKLKDEELWYASRLFTGSLPSHSPATRLLFAVPVIAVASLVGGIFQPMLFAGTGVLLIMNSTLRRSFKSQLFVYGVMLSYMRTLTDTARKVLRALPGDGVFEDDRKRLAKALTALKPLERLLLPTVINERSGNDLMDIFSMYLNRVFLIDVLMYLRVVNKLDKHRGDIRVVFEETGRVDTLIALASFRSGVPQWCQPEWHQDGILDYEQVYHPLLDTPVPNDLRLESRGMLLTGSNMSGKSTFIRTLGANQLLAQTAGFCCAERARIPMLRVQTAIHNQDMLEEGVSYYQAEVMRVRQLMEEAEDGIPVLVLLDELFRGTNTIERIAAAASVLRYLHKNGAWVVAATHDLELIDLVDHFTMKHFREEVHDGGLTFDYTLREGPASTRNAIALLRVQQYPDSLVTDAIETARMLEQRYRPLRVSGVFGHTDPSEPDDAQILGGRRTDISGR